MKTVRINDFLGNSQVDVSVIDEVIETSYNTLNEWLRQFSGKSEIPIIMIGSFRDCSMFYRLKMPFEIADENHEVFRTPGIDREGGIWRHEFYGPELVARLAHPGEVQIGHYANNEQTLHPEERAETWNIVFGNYAVVLPCEPISPKTRSYPLHFVIGEEECRQQLEVWRIKDIGRKTDIFGRVIGSVNGLL